MDRLHHDVLLRQSRQLFFHQLEIFLTRTYIYILLWQDPSKTFKGGLEHRLSGSEKVEELLGVLVPARWPQSSTTSSCKYYAEIVFPCYFHGWYISCHICVRS